ncbi:MAG TPA: alpha/beta fold hydrolase [Chloroflexota bacterium]|nr:alpha/beta fold hydrolase [Chloroflexota bacterium]
MATLISGEYDLAMAEGTLHYTITGTGPACIALSGGSGMDPRYFEDLGGLADTLTLVMLHPRGAGRSSFPDDSDWRLEGYARDVEALRRHLGIERPLVLGHSHGGWIAQHYALNYPAGPAALILVNTAARTRPASGWNAEEAMRPFANEPWFAAVRAAWEEVVTPETPPEQVAARGAAVGNFYFARLTPEVDAHIARVGPLACNLASTTRGNGPEQARRDWRDRVPDIQVPTLVLAGRHDWVQTVARAVELTGLLPRVELVIFEDTGHFPWVEERQRFHTVIQDFVRRLDPREC